MAICVWMCIEVSVFIIWVVEHKCTRNEWTNHKVQLKCEMLNYANAQHKAKWQNFATTLKLQSRMLLMLILGFKDGKTAHNHRKIERKHSAPVKRMRNEREREEKREKKRKKMSEKKFKLKRTKYKHNASYTKNGWIQVDWNSTRKGASNLFSSYFVHGFDLLFEKWRENTKYFVDGINSKFERKKQRRLKSGARSMQ